MKRFVAALLFFSGVAFSANGVYSDTTISQQGVGFRATVTVFNSGTQTKATLYRDKLGQMGLGNPFQSSPNGRFTFFAANGWYDLMVSGVGVTNYTYTVFVTDGTFSTSGQASGDLSGQYPGPTVRGLVGKQLPATAPAQDRMVPTFSLSQNKFVWSTPIFTLPTGTRDILGVYPDLRVTGLWSRQIDDVNPPNEGDTLRYRSLPGKWKYEPMATSPTSMVFNICRELCTVTPIAGSPYVATSSIAIQRCWITSGVPPQGSNLIVDIVKSGAGSIYPSGNSNKLNLTPVGGVESKIPNTPGTGVAGDIFVASILQIGNVVAGQNVTVACQITGN